MAAGTPNVISEISICNLALMRMGSVSQIQSLDTSADSSTEAVACAQWYPQDRDAILTDFPFNWARGNAQLAQVNTSLPATPEWQYSYRYPADCLSCWRIVPAPTIQPIAGQIPQTTGIGGALPAWADQWWNRPEGQPWPWSFDIEQDANGRLIVTDLVNAWLLYTRAVSDPSQFSADFADLLSWRLATDLAITLGVSANRAKLAQEGYARALGQTRARFANERQTGIAKVSPASTLTRARWVGW